MFFIEIVENIIPGNIMDSSEPSIHHQNTNRFMRSQYYDVMVKVDADVYYLNKLLLALKSDYFEKLLTEYSDQKECNLIQLPVMDTDTFSAIVDMIYGKELASVLNDDNYVSLLIAMDYLQMDIDSMIYANFIEQKPTADARIFTLYNYIRDNPNMQYLIVPILKYISEHFIDLRSNKELLSLSLDHFAIILHKASTGARGLHIIRQTCQICAEWIHDDIKNRLPHAAQLLNAAKLKLHIKGVHDAHFNVQLPQITEHMTPEILAKLFRKCLVFDGEINPVHDELLKDVNYNENEIPIGSKRNQLEKLAKFVENNYFYDTEVKVEEKIYKLHRFMLNSASGYFNENSSKQSNTNTQSSEALTQQPIRINEYLLRGVDQITFDMIVKYIYFNELQITSENITCLLKAANMLKIEKLFHDCISWMKENIEEVCTKILIIDECTRIDRSWMEENIEAVCSDILTGTVIGDELSIYSISFDTLEDLLLSSSVCCRNAHQLLEICSKWVMHDVKNRYHLIPQIALAINRNRMIDHDDHKMQDVDFNNLSEQSIRDKLWNILSSTSLISSAFGTKMPNKGTKRKLHEIPVFLAWTGDDKIHILNSNLDQIESFCFVEYTPNLINQYFKFAATLISDNLFIMFSVLGVFRTFYAYNVPSRKFISLNRNNLTVKEYSLLQRYWLLNCRGQIYCCFKQGSVFKYWTELNLWMIFSAEPKFGNIEAKKRVWFTSDGNELYRMYQMSDTELGQYVIEAFNFQEDLWLKKTSFKVIQYSLHVPINLTITSGNTLTVIFASCFKLFDQNTRVWSHVSWAEGTRTRGSIRNTPFAFTQYQDKLIHVLGNNLYQKSHEDPRWQLKKELPLRSDLSSSSRSSMRVDVTPYPYKYAYITAIHVF
ncbi:uncharacterized protein LOC135837417 [Planococcus citri]|uniref:uncharacterized protein LOC135837417 n=1 Tax=Planococcus citri TaxID=170843 RepID=UPI0031F987BE